MMKSIREVLEGVEVFISNRFQPVFRNKVDAVSEMVFANPKAIDIRIF